jgi:ubiquitin-protein ligase
MAQFNNKVPLDAEKNIGRITRLLSDYKRITELFKAHEHISIKEVFGAPPERYHILYRIDGLEKTGNAIEVKNIHVVEIALPSMYPWAAPVCRMVTSIFHPNISDDGIDIKEYWTPSTTLADLIVRIGEMIAFQKYDTKRPVAPDAATWADRNASMLPLSPVDLSYTEPELPSPALPGSDFTIQDRQPAGAPQPEDARKADGITIDSGTGHISIEADAAESETQGDQIDTVLIVPPEYKPATHRVVRVDKDAAPAFPKSAPLLAPRASEHDLSRANTVLFGKPAPRAIPREREAASTFLPASRPPESDTSVPQEKYKEAELSTPAFQREIPAKRFPGGEQLSSREDTISCSECGKSNIRTSNYCSNCGSRLFAEPPSVRRPTAKILISFLVSAPVAILALGAALILTRQNRPVSHYAAPPLAVPRATAQAPALAAPEPKKAVVPNQDSANVRPPVVATAPKPHRTATLTAGQKQAQMNEAFTTAQTYLDAGSFDDAMNKYMYVLKLDPGNDDALEGLRMVKAARDKAAADGVKKN